MNNYEPIEPIAVDTPEPISVLESALIALEPDTKTEIYLSPRQALALLAYIEKLEGCQKRLAKLEHQLVKLSEMGRPLVGIWDNEIDGIYDREE